MIKLIGRSWMVGWLLLPRWVYSCHARQAQVNLYVEHEYTNIKRKERKTNQGKV